jgi:site-specific DNA-methyltransferase (adenine-specific)
MEGTVAWHERVLMHSLCARLHFNPTIFNLTMPLPQFLNRIYSGEALKVLKRLPTESVDCVVTSPPYWSLRDYGVRHQLGLEERPEEYIERLCAIFDEVRRVLKPDGTCWVNLGDAYTTRSSKTGKTAKQPQPILSAASNKALNFRRPLAKLPAKCLVQLPARFALSMIDRGWILRNEIIWHKPNCLPQSARDRFTVDFERLFFFVKQRHYYFQQQFEPLQGKERLLQRLLKPGSLRKRVYGDKYVSAINPSTAEASRLRILRQGRNKRAIWRIAVRPFRGEHFAVYPSELIETPIKAGCPKGGIVLDPFMGSGDNSPCGAQARS